jgi:hypothetical protein
VRELGGREHKPAPEARPQPSVVESSEQEVAFEAMEPHEEALLRLVQSAAEVRRPISLVDWKSGEPQLSELTDEEWILYASTQVEAEGLQLTFLYAPAIEGQLNERYYDAMVSG